MICEEKERRKQLAEAYLAFEIPWQKYRKKHPEDTRNASKCGDPKVAEAAKKFLVLMEEWEKDNPLPKGKWWGMSPSGPVAFRGA